MGILNVVSYIADDVWSNNFAYNVDMVQIMLILVNHILFKWPLAVFWVASNDAIMVIVVRFLGNCVGTTEHLHREGHGCLIHASTGNLCDESQWERFGELISRFSRKCSFCPPLRHITTTRICTLIHVKASNVNYLPCLMWIVFVSCSVLTASCVCFYLFVSVVCLCVCFVCHVSMLNLREDGWE